MVSDMQTNGARPRARRTPRSAQSARFILRAGRFITGIVLIDRARHRRVRRRGIQAGRPFGAARRRAAGGAREPAEARRRVTSGPPPASSRHARSVARGRAPRSSRSSASTGSSRASHGAELAGMRNELAGLNVWPPTPLVSHSSRARFGLRLKLEDRRDKPSTDSFRLFTRRPHRPRARPSARASCGS